MRPLHSHADDACPQYTKGWYVFRSSPGGSRYSSQLPSREYHRIRSEPQSNMDPVDWLWAQLSIYPRCHRRKKKELLAAAFFNRISLKVLYTSCDSCSRVFKACSFGFFNLYGVCPEKKHFATINDTSVCFVLQRVCCFDVGTDKAVVLTRADCLQWAGRSGFWP